MTNINYLLNRIHFYKYHKYLHQCKFYKNLNNLNIIHFQDSINLNKLSNNFHHNMYYIQQDKQYNLNFKQNIHLYMLDNLSFNLYMWHMYYHNQYINYLLMYIQLYKNNIMYQFDYKMNILSHKPNNHNHLNSNPLNISNIMIHLYILNKKDHIYYIIHYNYNNIHQYKQYNMIMNHMLYILNHKLYIYDHYLYMFLLHIQYKFLNHCN